MQAFNVPDVPDGVSRSAIWDVIVGCRTGQQPAPSPKNKQKKKVIVDEPSVYRRPSEINSNQSAELKWTTQLQKAVGGASL